MFGVRLSPVSTKNIMESPSDIHRSGGGSFLRNIPEVPVLHTGGDRPSKLPQRGMTLQKHGEVPFDVERGNPGHPVPHQLHRGCAVASLRNQRSEGIPEVMAGRASQAGAGERTIHKVRHTGASEPFVSASFLLDYLGVIVQDLSQTSQQVCGLRKDNNRSLPLFPVAQNHAVRYRPYISGYYFKYLMLPLAVSHQEMEHGKFSERLEISATGPRECPL